MSERIHTDLTDASFQGVSGIREVYFIGIGGIGMSAIARFFHSKGVRVSGYDRSVTQLTRDLEAAGIAVHYEEDPARVPANPDIIVYTPAIPASHAELIYYQQQGRQLLKRSDVLKIISESSFNICIAGTHGKTTVTTMVAHLLRDTGYGCNAFLGGISVNYGTNFWSDARNVSVIEADEYDRSFLKLSPDIAIITAMDADHLDIYGTPGAVEQAFLDFAERIRPEGLLVCKYGLSRGRELKAPNVLSYHLENKAADAYAENIILEDGSYMLDIVCKGRRFNGLKLNMGGLHNVENLVGAVAAIENLGIETEAIRSAVSSFRGVKRRFEYIIKNDKLVFIDDYAHHPEELRVLLQGAKGLFPDRKCTVIFQPHLFSRTRDFVEGFAEVLAIADEVILLPIYPARELPMEGVNSEMLLTGMKDKKGRVMQKEQLIEWIESDFAGGAGPKLLITAGAGDIDTLLKPIKDLVS